MRLLLALSTLSLSAFTLGQVSDAEIKSLIELPSPDASVVMIVRLDKPIPEANARRNHDALPLIGGFRRNVVTSMPDGSPNADNPLSLAPFRQVVIRIIPPHPDDKVSVTIDTPPFTGTDLAPQAMAGSAVKYVEITLPARRDKVTSKVTITSGDSKSYQFSITQADKHDFATEFGGMYVARANELPAFGIRKGIVSLGRSQTMTLDVVSLFKDQEDTDLGGALTYSCMLGTRYKESLRGIFGFPMTLTFTIGFQGLNTGRVDRSQGAFFGIGFSIPTGG